MQLTELSPVLIALGVALALTALVMLVSRWQARRLKQRRAGDVWSAGTAPDSSHSRAKKAGATLATGLAAGCGGCGGCGCGG